MSKAAKPKWRRYLPKDKIVQNEVWRKSMLYGSRLWKESVQDKDRALLYLEDIIRLIERKKLNIKASLAVILEQSNTKLGTNKGVGFLQDILFEILEETAEKEDLKNQTPKNQ